MNSDRYDLNLLVVFDAVARTGSVTSAASRLCMSQPAVSHALNRLRDVVGDPLFVRNRNALVPTPRAQEMIEPVRGIVEAARGVLRQGDFDAATSERVFRVGGSDYTMMVIAPALAGVLRKEAPRSTLDLVPVGPQTLASLESGEIDCSFWGAAVPAAPYLSRSLFRERFIGVVGRQHPLAEKISHGRLTLDDYLAYPHAVTQFRISVANPVDIALAKLGRSRTVGFASPSFAGNAAAMRGTDMVMTIPAGLAPVLVDKNFVTFELPLDVTNHPYSLIWHRRSDADPACRWLREMAVAAAKRPRRRKSAR